MQEAWRAAELCAPEWAWDGRVLIFTTTTAQAKVAAAVIEETFKVACRAYCSNGMTPEERARSLAEWDSGTVHVMVATKSMAQGIDRPDISFVMHFGLPQDIDEWSQENGRAARGAGRRGLALTFLHPRFVTDRLRLSMGDDTDGSSALCGAARLLKLLTAERCLRESTLEYLGGWRSERCPPIECCCRCQRRLNGELLDHPIIGLSAQEVHRAASTLLRDVANRVKEAPYGLVSLSGLLNQPGSSASATEHALLVMALVGQGSISLRRVVTTSGWSSAIVAVGINELEAERFDAGSNRLLLALPYRPPDPVRPPPSAQRRAEAAQALFSQHIENEAGIARLPNLYIDFRDAGGDIDDLPSDLQARLRETTAHWLLPSEEEEEVSMEEEEEPPIEEAVAAMGLDVAAAHPSGRKRRAQASPEASPSVRDHELQRMRVLDEVIPSRNLAPQSLF